METKTYVKHVKTGEVFEVEYEGNKFLTTWDDKGEKRIFKTEMLAPYEPEEAWEDVPNHLIQQDWNGLYVIFHKDGFTTYSYVPSEQTRTIIRDGKLVVQRRKT